MQPELVASGTLFARIFHASPVAMAIYARNDGRCVAANDAFARLFGYDAGALVGQRVEDLGLLDDEARRQLGTTVLSAAAWPTGRCAFARATAPSTMSWPPSSWRRGATRPS